MRAINFSPGPAALPASVLERAQREMLDYAGTGMSVMEMSHRSPEFIEIANNAEQDFRTLLNVSDDYAVLFLQGGATAQFAGVPLNLLGEKTSADYVDTGSWSKKAIKEAGKYGAVNVVASGADNDYASIPDPSSWARDANAAYLHLCSNETIGGLQFDDFPVLDDVPLVADMSSDILSRPIDVSTFGVIYAGAQKNLGPSGLTLVVVRRDLLDRARADTPTVLHYATQAAADSMSNTPPTYAWYLAGLVFRWALDQGGLAEIERNNRRKADTLYSVIDASNFYQAPVQARFRSTMNVPFTLADDALDAAFLAGAKERSMVNLKGHRSVGGMRASLYNAVSQANVEALVEYMRAFEREHG